MSSFRITTNGLFRNYRTNLYKNNKKLQDSMTSVQTERKFNTYAEDPAAASKAWRLRRSFWLTGDQIDNNNYAISKYESASAAMHSIVDGDAGNDIQGLNGILSSIRGLSDTSGSSRSALGKELIQTAENMVAVMNSKYGDDFVFSGADGKNAPFQWDDEGRLLYRGVNVNLGTQKTLSDFGLSESDLNGLQTTDFDMKEPKAEDYVTDDYTDGTSNPDYVAAKAKFDKVTELFAQPDSTNETKYPAGENDLQYKADLEKYQKLTSFRDYALEYRERNGVSYETGAEGYAKLQSMANEATYIDIGIGMKEDENGNLIPGTAFNSSISGLNFLGYGEDKNLAVIVRELGEIFSRADPETGAYEKPETDAKRASELLDRLHEAVQASQGQHTKLEADAKYLKTNLGQLEDNRYQLNEQINDTERMDMAEAITEMSWAQYCYNAALRIGTNILSQSLIDYMG